MIKYQQVAHSRSTSLKFVLKMVCWFCLLVHIRCAKTVFLSQDTLRCLGLDGSLSFRTWPTGNEGGLLMVDSVFNITFLYLLYHLSVIHHDLEKL